MATADVNSNGADAETDLVDDYGIVTFEIGQTSAFISVLAFPDNVSQNVHITDLVKNCAA